jgi:hypothetical protein
MGWAEHVVRIGERRGVYRDLMGKTEGKRPKGIPSSRWEHNIKMDLQVQRFVIMDWIELAQDRESWRALLGVVISFRVPKKVQEIS